MSNCDIRFLSNEELTKILIERGDSSILRRTLINLVRAGTAISPMQNLPKAFGDSCISSYSVSFRVTQPLDDSPIILNKIKSLNKSIVLNVDP